MSKKKTHEEYVAELAVKNPTVEVVETYINANTKIMHHCLVHDVYFEIAPSSVLYGAGCNKCHNERKASSQKKTTSKYVFEVAKINPNIVVVGEYIGAKTPIRHKCKIHNIEWMSRPGNILSGRGCPECANEKRSALQVKTHEQYIDELKEINSNIIVIGKYVNARTPILHKCIKDGYEWYAAPDRLLRGQGCPKCANHVTRTHEQYVDELSFINPDINVIEQYINAITPIIHKCKIDGNTWKARPNDILNGKGCPQCNESHGERQIRIWLDSHEIDYIPQKTFDDCVDDRALPFDFYLPNNNVAIEYQGVQHYRPVEYFGGKSAFEKLKRHDAIKANYCNENKIKLLAIPYTNDVNEELNNFLFI